MALLSAGCGGTAQKSPSGNIRAEVFAGKEGLYYTVTHDGRTVIDTSAMGVTVDGTELFRDAALRPAGTRKIDETYSVTGRKAVSEGRVRRAEFRVETAHLCRRVDIHDGRQPAHRLPAGTGADHAAALPPPPTNT